MVVADSDWDSVPETVIGGKMVPGRHREEVAEAAELPTMMNTESYKGYRGYSRNSRP